METILKISNLHKKFRKVHAVNNVSLEIKKGNVYGILGPNGSGKSTTLGIVLNVVNKTSGDFEWFDGSLSTHDALKKVGAIIERPNFYPYMTAEENLKLVCKIKNIPFDKVNEKLELVGLFDRKDSKFKTFSLGMKQRLGIAAALLPEPKLLMLDEPTNGLDPEGIQEVRALLRDLANDGTTVFVSSHLLSELEIISDHIVMLRKGEIVFAGPIGDLMAKQQPTIIAKSLQHSELAQIVKIAEASGHHAVIRNDSVHILAPMEWAPVLNKAAFDAGITLAQLAPQLPNLEETFFEMTGDK